MTDIMNKTYRVKKYKPSWHLIDAKNKTLGRISTIIAQILTGKNRADYTRNQIKRFHIIIINAEHIQVSGNKKHQKLYRRHSGRPGGMKAENFTKLQQRIPQRIIEKSVKGMLPKNILGRHIFKNLKVYCGASHPHNAQLPIIL